MDLQGTVSIPPKKNLFRRPLFVGGIFVIFCVVFVFSVSSSRLLPKIVDFLRLNTAYAGGAGQYTPTGGNLQTGAELPISSNSSTANVGSWKGTFSAEAGNLRWEVSSTASGLDQELYIDGVHLNGANKFIINALVGSASTSLERTYQICDWISNSSVDNVVDSNCTGGGWRTLNKTNGSTRKTMAEATNRTYTWHIYDGYWTTSVTTSTSVSTPLSNFIKTDPTNRILLRAYSTSSVVTSHFFNRLELDAVVDPIYFPAGFTQLGGGTVTGSYVNIENPPTLSSGGPTGQNGDDNVYLSVSDTPSAADFYLTFDNIKTYTGANTIVMRAQPSCSVTTSTVAYKPKIWNFTTSLWEDMSATSTPCSTTETTYVFAKNNITISDYISGGHAKVGWYASATSSLSLRIDFMYIIVGSTNSNSSQCEISFGTGTAASCTATRDIDTTLGSFNTWQPTTELESDNMSHDYYPYDNDGDTTIGEAAASVNVNFPMTLPSNARLNGLVYAANFRSNSASSTLYPQFRDYSGSNYQTNGGSPTGGWISASGLSSAATTYTYGDAISGSYFTHNPEDFIDTVNDVVNMRIRTSASTLTSNVTPDVDFMFVAPQWVEESPVHPTIRSSYTPTGGKLQTGDEQAITSNSDRGNVGSWRGTFSSEANGFTWTASTTASGLDQELYLDGVQLNGANKFVISAYLSSNSASLNRFYQICDWTSNSSVDSAADSNCTGGGWRTVNRVRAPIAAAGGILFVWHIYDGYWTTSVSTSTTVSTPLSNFISPSTQRVLIRVYSTSTVGYNHGFDRLELDAVVDPIYFPAGFTQLGGGTVSGSYVNVENPPTLASGGSGGTGSDNVYISVSSTPSAADFYFTFSNVKTYTGANTIMMRAEYSCTAAGPSHKPKIWNFTTSLWEDLTTTSIACAAADATDAFAKNNININDYVSGGQIKIGWYTTSTSTQSLRLDWIYIIVGSTNSDSSQCEISFGSGTASDCAATRNIDTTLGSPTLWQVSTEAESDNMSHSYYSNDNDSDAVGGEQAASVNVNFPVTLPANSDIVGWAYAHRVNPATTTVWLRTQFRDFSGADLTSGGSGPYGGWIDAPPSYFSSASLTYGDAISSGYMTNNPEDYLDTTNNVVNLRLRTASSSETTVVSPLIDFMFVAPRWTESVSLDTTPPTPNPMTWATAPTSTATSSVSMTATTGSDTTPQVNYLFTNVACTSNGDTGGASFPWTISTSYTNSGLQTNKCYAYTVTARDSVIPTPNTGTASASSSVYTLANVPGAPTIGSPTTSTLTLTNAENGNPSVNPTTYFAVYVSSTSPNDSNWQGKWVKTDGTASSSEAWMTDVQADAVVVKNLATSTTYTFKVKARNENAKQTALGPAGNGMTSAGGGGGGNPPNAPTLSAPVSGVQNVSTQPAFQMTATDPEANKLQYKVAIYSNSGCGTLISGPYDQSSSQTGWSGQNAQCSVPNDCYNSNSQGTYTMQSALAQGVTYYWRAWALDPAPGSNTWGAVSSCNSFTTTAGYWTTDSGNWSINVSQQLVVTPSSGSSTQIHVSGQSRTDSVIDFKAKSSAVGAGTGNFGGIVRALADGSRRYWLGVADVLNNKHSIGKTSSTYSILTSSTFGFGANTFYQFRGKISGTALNSWINGGTALSVTDSSIGGSGFLGLAASSTSGIASSTYDNFALYTSSTITMNNLSACGASCSWAVRDHLGNVTSTCLTANTWDLSAYPGQVPIDYDAGGGSIAVWTNATCSGGPAVTYPSVGNATDTFGGDVYTYNAASGGGGGGGSTVASSSININAAGLITF